VKLDNDVENNLRELRKFAARGADAVLVELITNTIGASYSRGTEPQPAPFDIVSAASNVEKNTALQELAKAISQLQKPGLEPGLIEDVLSKLQHLVQ
jgi:hypothetical protein